MTSTYYDCKISVTLSPGAENQGSKYKNELNSTKQQFSKRASLSHNDCPVVSCYVKL